MPRRKDRQYDIPPLPKAIAVELKKAVEHIARSETGGFTGTGGGWDAGGQAGVRRMKDCMIRLINKHSAPQDQPFNDLLEMALAEPGYYIVVGPNLSRARAEVVDMIQKVGGGPRVTGYSIGAGKIAFRNGSKIETHTQEHGLYAIRDLAGALLVDCGQMKHGAVMRVQQAARRLFYAS